MNNSRQPLSSQSAGIDHVTGIDDEYGDVVFEGMNAVVNEKRGTAYGVFPENSDIAGKTGTAQVFSLRGGEYDEDSIQKRLQDHALFVAYAPAEDPSIALAVVVENGGGGGSVAAPIARKVLDAYFKSTLLGAPSE